MKLFLISPPVKLIVKFVPILSKLAAVTAVVAFVVVAIHAQAVNTSASTSGRLQINHLDRFAAKAIESINVNMDERLLRIVPPLLSKDPEEAKAKELIADLKGIYVKRFEFESEGAYVDADLAPIREQLQAPGWSRIVEVRSKREGNNVEVYLLTNGGRIDGLAILSFEPKELTVINIVGSVDLDKLRRLEGQFGVPDLELERDSKPQPKKP